MPCKVSSPCHSVQPKAYLPVKWHKKQIIPLEIDVQLKCHISVYSSATLSGGPEIYGRSSFDYFFSGGAFDPEPGPGGEDDLIVSDAQNQSDWQLFDRVRSQDIRLLKTFQVETIVDLMVEKKSEVWSQVS